jgi:integrase
VLRLASLPISPKSVSSRRKVLLPEFVCKLIDEYIKDYCLLPDDYLFFSFYDHRLPIGATTVYRAVADGCRKAGIPYFRFHSFRHSLAIILVDSGFSVEVVSNMLGHSSSEITNKYYLHCAETDSEKVDSFLTRVLSGEKNGSVKS